MRLITDYWSSFTSLFHSTFLTFCCSSSFFLHPSRFSSEILFLGLLHSFLHSYFLFCSNLPHYFFFFCPFKYLPLFWLVLLLWILLPPPFNFFYFYFFFLFVSFFISTLLPLYLLLSFSLFHLYHVFTFDFLFPLLTLQSVPFFPHGDFLTLIFFITRPFTALLTSSVPPTVLQCFLHPFLSFFHPFLFLLHFIPLFFTPILVSVFSHPSSAFSHFISLIIADKLKCRLHTRQTVCAPFAGLSVCVCLYTVYIQCVCVCVCRLLSICLSTRRHDECLPWLRHTQRHTHTHTRTCTPPGVF